MTALWLLSILIFQSFSNAKGRVVSPIRPLYECDHLNNSILLSDWYSFCKTSCSPFYGLVNASFTVYRDPRENVKINTFAVKYISTKVSSHTDILDNCNYIKSSIVKIIDEKDLMSVIGKVSKAAKLYPDNTTLIIDDPVTPPCSYFKDNYASYDSIIAIKYPGKLSYYNDTNLGVTIPALSSYMISNSGYGRLGDKVIFWESTDDLDKDCPLIYKGSYDCIYRKEQQTVECPSEGLLFRIVRALEKEHCGIETLFYGGYGYYLQINDQRIIPPFTSILAGETALLSDQSVASIIGKINYEYGKFTDALCESICDISDQVFSIPDTSNSVIETPIGPWLGWRSPKTSLEHIYYVSACRRVTEWKLHDPLHVCNRTSGFTITNTDGAINLWDPKNTYFIPSQSCDDFDLSDLCSQIEKNDTLYIKFWGKNLMVQPPYDVNASWEDSKTQIFRSSKWLPYIHGVSINNTEEFYIFLDRLNKYVTSTRSVKNAYTEPRKMIDLGKWTETLLTDIKSLYGGLVSGIQHLQNALNTFIKFIPVLLILSLMWIIWKISHWFFFGSVNAITNHQEVHRRPNQDFRLGVPEYNLIRMH